MGRYYDEIILCDLVELATTIANRNIIPDLYYNLIQVQENYKDTFTKDIQPFNDPTDSLFIDELEDNKKEERENVEIKEESSDKEETETKEVKNGSVDEETLIIQKSEQDE